MRIHCLFRLTVGSNSHFAPPPRLQKRKAASGEDGEFEEEEEKTVTGKGTAATRTQEAKLERKREKGADRPGTGKRGTLNPK
ncbi:hypothetical protein NDU88_002619 [Pleurodeles waltl]|uniref:Uncharacterized protein n=1 Tax=Pleurodeles waltl TaxID=8319 RepID=A0AAV7SDR9_PLEWA|nr:hypothetical protein NDU88_002619 [Pleurodeles waltl]